MSEPRPKQQAGGNLVVATGWSAAVLAAIAVLGLAVAPSLQTIWLVLLVLAVAAVPQAVLIVRRENRKRSPQ